MRLIDAWRGAQPADPSVTAAVAQKTLKSEEGRASISTEQHTSQPAWSHSGSVASADALDEERWRQQQAVLRRAARELAQRRTESGAPSLMVRADPFQRLADSLDDTSDQECSETVRNLYSMDPDRAVSYFNVALGESSPERRRKIGEAIAASGLVSEAIKNLTGGSQSNSYRAFSLLLLVAKAGEIEPLIEVIENHPSVELRLAVIRLLASSGERAILPTLERLVISKNLPLEVRSALRDVIKQVGGADSASSTA